MDTPLDAHEHKQEAEVGRDTGARGADVVNGVAQAPVLLLDEIGDHDGGGPRDAGTAVHKDVAVVLAPCGRDEAARLGHIVLKLGLDVVVAGNLFVDELAGRDVVILAFARHVHDVTHAQRSELGRVRGIGVAAL